MDPQGLIYGKATLMAFAHPIPSNSKVGPGNYPPLRVHWTSPVYLPTIRLAYNIYGKFVFV